MKELTELVVCVLVLILTMSDFVGTLSSHSSSSSNNLSNNHKHRYHHHHRDGYLRSRFTNSTLSEEAKESGTSSVESSIIYNQVRKDHKPLQHDDDDGDGAYQRIPNFSEEQTALPHSTATSPGLYTGGNHKNNSLRFTKRPLNNNNLITNIEPPSFYIHPNIRGSNAKNLPIYDTDYVPFHLDVSEYPQSNMELYPDVLSPPSPDLSQTLPKRNDGSYDQLPFTPWALPPGDIDKIHENLHTSTTSRPMTIHSLYNSNITKSAFGQNDVQREIDFIVPIVNFSTPVENEFNSSWIDGDNVTANDLYSWSILLMAPLVIFGVGGNTLVILAISLEKRLQNVTNYFLLSLAVTDLLVSIIVMPFSIINVFTGRWLFGLLLCDFFVTSDVLMCTSSILHLCTISLERYIGIRYPLWTKYKSKRIVLLKIVFVWTIALAITSPITVLGVIKQENVLVSGECVLSNPYFIIYGSTFAFFIPLAIMVLMYVLTVRMLNKQAMLCQIPRVDDGETQPIIRRSTSRRNWQPRRKYYSRTTFNSGSSINGTRLVVDDDVTIAMTEFRLKSYRSPGVTRHNTIPVGHYRCSEYTRKDATGSENGSVGGSNGSLHRGRSNITITSSNSHICSVDARGRSSPSRSNGQGKKFSDQNRTGHLNYGTGSTCYGTGSSNYEPSSAGYKTGSANYTGVNSSSEFQFANGLQEEMTIELPSDSQNCCSSRLSSSSSSSSPTSSTNREPRRPHETSRKHHVAVKAASILLMKRDTNDQGQSHSPAHTSSTRTSVRRDNSVRTEQKASKVLGVVFMIFVICWAPFFTVNILTAVCTTCQFEPTLITAFVWLGYVSSTLNPIIYTIFNNIFRITFIKLLCCRYRLLHRARRSSTMTGVRNGLVNFSDFSPAHANTTITVNTSSTFVEESNC